MWLAAAIAAASGPSLLAFNVSPSPTLLNQVLALALWGGFVAAAALAPTGGGPLRDAARALAWPLAALGLVLAGVLWSWGPGALPSGLALSAAGLLLAAMLLLFSGAAARGGAAALPLFACFCAGWVVAGVLNAGIGIVQVFAPGWPDGSWLASSGLPGRAVGNLRQPNHLSSLLLWSAIAVVPLVELGRLRRGPGWALFALMCFAVVLTASRTGALGVGLLALWGLLDRRLSRPVRLMLLAAPLLYLLAWLGLSAWAASSHHAFGGEARLAEADLSSSRFAIWSDTLALIRQQPWTGVGFGEFNLAWTLTPFPGRPVAFFDHTHNLPLQLAVELGVPVALLVLALLAAALWRIWTLARDAGAVQGMSLRSAWMMLLLMALHSQLEYPLWYAYFLLPTAWLLGYGLGRGRPAAAPRSAAGALLCAGGLLLAAASVLTLADYLSVVRIFAPTRDGTPLAQRIADGERSWLFAHHAGYAAATVDDDLAATDRAFREAPHYLMDTRLMIAWAEALARAGELDKARYLAQRLREFRNPQADAFFAPCGAEPAPQPPPFQCETPREAPSWRDYLR
ncbi:MAG TPA: Wzy polymerase domain-containing protein [Rubrivivax sp.]|nr:Wzy polymerase domain-containing protein [Rubrivivax sp.]